MSGPEDNGSHTVADAARFERWRSRNYDPPEDGEGDPPSRRRARVGCRCHSASETPCDHCSGGP